VQARFAVPQPTKVAGTLRRAVRRQAFERILGGLHIECAYYFRWTAHGMCLLLWVDGTWNVPTTLTFFGCAKRVDFFGAVI
jgi:hypothetical protein